MTNVRAFAVVRVLVPRAQEEMARRLLSQGFELPEDVEPTEDEAGQAADGVSSHAMSTGPFQRPWVALLFWLLMVAVGVLAWEFVLR